LVLKQQMVWMSKRNVGARHQQIIGKYYQCNTAVPRRNPQVTEAVPGRDRKRNVGHGINKIMNAVKTSR